MKRFGRIAIGIGIVAALAYLLALAGMFLFQRDFQYDRGGRLFALSETRLAQAELVRIPSAAGSSLAGWYQPPAAGKPLIVYFRGNAQSFSREHERYEAFVADGYGSLAFDYRGFPGSPGEVSEANILADGLAAYDWAAAKGFPIVLWGRSLGSGPATYVASLRDADALLLETPFDSAVAVAADRYGFLPVGLLMADQFPVDSWIKDVAEPVFVAHGTADRTIGVSHGERVYALAPNPDELWIEPGAGHSDMWARGLWERAKAFFARAEAGAR
ncbi:alpha/beta hydrolase [Devosia sp. A16]|uniref:alpha/beta hydrolase n=1 Tax=Devosia sp. A16 TaxID=1736675 RepID=UPI0006D84B6B|nr:alpha/beta hydrolase [Devosia sp. A16]